MIQSDRATLEFSPQAATDSWVIGERDLLGGQRHADENDAVEVAQGFHAHADAVAREIEMRLLLDKRIEDPGVASIDEREQPPIIKRVELDWIAGRVRQLLL